MSRFRGTLLWGLYVAVQWLGVIGYRYLPPEAIHFNKCHTSHDCPRDSSCLETKHGYYCACDKGFYNDIDRLTITYPGGQCTVMCPSGGIGSYCTCSAGYVRDLNDKGLYICKNKCAQNSDCPANAHCKSTRCYCVQGLCNSKVSSLCDPQVRLDEECTVQTGTPVQETTMIPNSHTLQADWGSTVHRPTPRISLVTALQLPQTAICLTNKDCPTDTVCLQHSCYCTHETCNSKHLPSCITLVLKDEECVDPFTTPGQTTQGQTTQGQTTHSQTTSSVTGPQHTQTGKRCQMRNDELEKCDKFMIQDVLCNFLRQNARIQENSCYRNHTNNTLQNVAQEFTEILNHTTLKNLTTSELRSAFTSIVNTVETSLLVGFSKEPKNENISTHELEAHMKASVDTCGRGEAYVTLVVLGNTMQVPCIQVSGARDGAILISYKSLGSKLNGNILGGSEENGREDRKEVNSLIISGATTSPDTKNLEPPVSFYLKQLKDVPPSFVLQCVFWDMEKKIWSSEGCDTKKSDRLNSTLCVCNHLSTFAVLMAHSDIEVDYGLVLVSRIGLSVSIFCLCLSLLTFILCRSIKSAHTSILAVLCGCLLVGQLLALLGLHQTGNTILCGVIAGVLQFSFLCAFCWMSLESALLFLTVRNLQAMNYMTSHKSHLPYVCTAGFGIPLIIVSISAAMRPGSYGTENYCWLREDLVWSFLGPVCVFITINFILLVITFVLLKKKLASLNTNVSTIKHTRLLTFKALSQLFILGCTWIIGIFQFGPGAQVISYIFTICNSLQGLYIFCVHCLLNYQVREEYRRGFRRFQFKKLESEAMSGSTVPMTIKSNSQASEVPRLDEKSVSTMDDHF